MTVKLLRRLMLNVASILKKRLKVCDRHLHKLATLRYQRGRQRLPVQRSACLAYPPSHIIKPDCQRSTPQPLTGVDL